MLCLTSALAYYDLTTYNPWQYEIAIERTKKITLPDYPPIKLVYFSNNQPELAPRKLPSKMKLIFLTYWKTNF